MKESEEVKINNIVLNVGKKEIVLSVDQAKKLKGLLEDLFGKEVIKEVKHEHHYDWYYKPWHYKYGNQVYCSSKTEDNSAQFQEYLSLSKNSDLNLKID